jgi:hypothetical protein
MAAGPCLAGRRARPPSPAAPLRHRCVSVRRNQAVEGMAAHRLGRCTAPSRACGQRPRCPSGSSSRAPPSGRVTASPSAGICRAADVRLRCARARGEAGARRVLREVALGEDEQELGAVLGRVRRLERVRDAWREVPQVALFLRRASGGAVHTDESGRYARQWRRSSGRQH